MTTKSTLEPRPLDGCEEMPLIPGLPAAFRREFRMTVAKVRPAPPISGRAYGLHESGIKNESRNSGEIPTCNKYVWRKIKLTS